MDNAIKFLKKNQYKLILIFVLIVGFTVRLIFIDKQPNALNVDEASSGYEAWSILNYGIDRNGNFLPIFLVAWGSGQNALYSYLMIPFIKLLGLNELSLRLPMAIVGCISLVIMYLLLKEVKDEKTALIGVMFYAICPWHIMKSRWALESNLFPELILLATYLIVLSLKREKSWMFYLSALILGISAYSYGTAYFFLPFFVIILLALLLKKKKIKLKDAIIFFGIVTIISLPMIVFVIINTFNLTEIELPFLTIPRLVQNRYETITTLFSGNVVANSLKNFVNSAIMLLIQSDGLPWNVIDEYGLIYIFSIIFTIIGMVCEFNKKDDYNYVINIWFIVSVLMLFVCEANINRCNIIIIPLIYYTIIGIKRVIDDHEALKSCILIIYIVYFILFEVTYFNIDWGEDSYYTFSNGVEEVIDYVENLQNVENIYFPYSIKEPYIYVLFYSQTDTNEYIETVVKKDENGTFENIISFGKYIFYDDVDFTEDYNNVYIIDKSSDIEFDSETWDIVDFEKYSVVRLKEDS